MYGMNQDTGQLMTDIEYLRQSIWRILSTPLGERIMRPDFGSRLPDLVDYPFNPSTRLAMEAATSDAIARWEATFDVHEVEVEMVEVGVVLITLVGEFFGRPTRVENIRISNRVEDNIQITPTPLDPSIPIVPPVDPTTPVGDQDYNSFVFGSGQSFRFGNDFSFIWK